MSQNNQKLEYWIYLACLMEATARKPGNVHPEASFPDLTYVDFVKSAAVIAPILAHTTPDKIGTTIRECISETQQVIPSNSNLGMVLLLAPLVAIPCEQTIAAGIDSMLDQLTVQDAREVYEAIRIAKPGGLGKTESEDVATEPTGTLRNVMCLAADRDSVASEYTHAFRITLESSIPALQEFWNQDADWEKAVIRLQLRLMSEFPDTLIARKCGLEEAAESAARARAVLEAEDYTASLSQFDAWLRQNGNQRNPGTTADLIVAALFVALRDGFIPTPELDTITRQIPSKLKPDLKNEYQQ
ncbi:triphosphoribosyl-dephospho-CoA synthase [Gimesia fumaroli]|uniref:ATP:dephospho-CoA triphosphoribosyl transferase n=1 Tax=Gimesia fumaroli TaxID=2527976 RepID=A0A518I7Y7_9PLAN|nr:triphosphoribosyl-dephospho-CoA synthase [Gimesia fumaroli]QDV49217.1 ATP:dephospho-CoA triphosphoribosyl transferase [Gimesia fumaroli]